ncbi:mitochondrial translation ribosome-binding ATPase YchF [Andalucia godoyi]|uniref:Obg-like ATPase 1 n=1 Tax=Andalucia godoyi TaxID=505711 RepID=A0A8K0AGR7_ANDGO|nr:mitochondrial translation ribosome-binding ATPase YchF [Andalucia godoyi]WCZ58590.1 ribosome-binding ATPase YchF [Andalucia godoyi]|eukprot:ANDGO_08171.mRNA.1 mitochondrial translation ribosome-binding ATPase YchF
MFCVAYSRRLPLFVARSCFFASSPKSVSGRKMPPKSAVVEEKIALGRVGSNLQVGIVGVPNVGKSSTFNLLTRQSVPAENYPFCTIDPNHARVIVPDARFDKLVEKYKPASAVPAFLQVTDIAGLVKGASEGAGLGNAFLSHIRATDAIFQIVRCFEDADVTHVEGGVDPVRDLEIISNELRLKDLEFLTKQLEQLTSKRNRGPADKEHEHMVDLTKRLVEVLEAGKDIRFGEWKNADIELLNTMQLLTAKPVLYIANMSAEDYERKKNKWLAKVKKWIDDHCPGEQLVPYSVKHETALLDQGKIEGSQLEKIITTGYHLLNLAHFFTAGEDEVKAWTIQKGTKAPQAAGKIHTDFERGFICAEVCKFEDLMEHGSEAACRAAGKYRQQGREYVVADGDIILFRFNVTKDAKKK